RAAHGAASQGCSPRERCRIGLDPRLAERAHDTRDVGGGERPQWQHPATGADRRQESRRAMCDDEEDRAWRRLLQDLREWVGAALIELVGAVADGDPPATAARGRVKEIKRAACGIDRDLRRPALAVATQAAADHREVGMGERTDLAG